LSKDESRCGSANLQAACITWGYSSRTSTTEWYWPFQETMPTSSMP